MSKANNKQSKGNGKRKGKDFKPSERKGRYESNTEERTEGYQNDPEWLAPDDVLLNQIASFSFSDTIGVPTNLHTTGVAPYDFVSQQELGNIMEIRTFPCVGEKMFNQTRSAVANAALEEYNLLSSDNGKTTQYTPPDLAFSILAVGEFVSLASNFVRAYGMMFNYNSRNRTVPLALVEAMGFDPYNFAENMAIARIRFNSIMVRANAIKLPTNIKYLVKCDEMYQNVFYDKGSAMGQYYVMRPHGYLKFNEASGGGSTLDFYIINGNLTVGQYLNILEDVLDQILTSTTFNYIFTDVIRYAERKGGTLMSFGYLEEHYRLDPVFSETFMNQVHNMTWGFNNITDPTGTNPYKISEDISTLDLVSTLTSDLSNSDVNIAKMGSRLLDFPYTDRPDPGMIADALEYMTIWNYITTPSASKVGGAHAYPDHPVYNVVLKCYGYAGNYNITFAQGLGDSLSAGQLKAMLCYETFDVKPLLYSYNSTDSATRVYGNLNYFTEIKYSQLWHIHDYAFLGLFKVRHQHFETSKAIAEAK